MAEIITFCVNRKLLVARMNMVKTYGVRLDGDLYLARGQAEEYIAWLREHPDKAPWGMLIEVVDQK